MPTVNNSNSNAKVKMASIETETNGALTASELIYLLCTDKKIKYLLNKSTTKVNLDDYLYIIDDNIELDNWSIRTFEEYQYYYEDIISYLSVHLKKKETELIRKYKVIFDAIVLEIFEKLT